MVLPTFLLQPNPFGSPISLNDYSPVKMTREQTIFHKNFSQSDLDVAPKHRRLEGLKNTIKMLSGPLVWLANTIYHAVTKFFSWVGSLFCEDKKTIWEQLSSQSPLDRIKQYEPKSDLGESGEHDYEEYALTTLRSCVDAYEEMYNRSPVIRSEKMNKILRSPATMNTPAKIRDAFLLQVPKKDKAEFKKKVHQARGRIVPTELKRAFTIQHKGQSHEFNEHSRNLDPSLGAKYLKAISKDTFSDEIKYIESHIDGDHIGIRTSTVRKEHHAQGMTTNAREHGITAKDGPELESTFRSGAFAVHDKYYPTESEYSKIEKGDLKTMKKLAKRWGVNINAVPATANERIVQRRQLCVAQALPKVIASVKKMAESGRSPEHGFLHVEQSFLSDKFASDREMIKDMAKALETIRQDVKVSFTDSEESVEMAESKIVINLKTPENFKGKKNEEYPIHAIFFSQGVNETQAVGHAFGSGGDTLQDQINSRGLRLLQEHARRIDTVNDPALTNLARHFSPTNKRKGVDLDGVHYIAKAVRALGGKRGFVCKSGKDRTGSEANDKLAYYATTHILRGKYNETLHKKIRDNLAGGISWTITGQCNGNANTYAFNELQHPVLPKNWKPPLRLCGNAKS